MERDSLNECTGAPIIIESRNATTIQTRKKDYFWKLDLYKSLLYIRIRKDAHYDELIKKCKVKIYEKYNMGQGKIHSFLLYVYIIFLKSICEKIIIHDADFCYIPLYLFYRGKYDGLSLKFDTTFPENIDSCLCNHSWVDKCIPFLSINKYCPTEEFSFPEYLCVLYPQEYPPVFISTLVIDGEEINYEIIKHTEYTYNDILCQLFFLSIDSHTCYQHYDDVYTDIKIHTNVDIAPVIYLCTHAGFD